MAVTLGFVANGMIYDPLDAMMACWNPIQGSLFPWMREEVDPLTEALGRLVTTLDVIGLEAFVPEPPRGAGRPPEDRRAVARGFVAKAILGTPTTTALIERLEVDKSPRRILGWKRRAQVPSEATFSRAFAEFAKPKPKPGRPRKDEERPRPEPTRLERQVKQNLNQMLADLPTARGVGRKQNSKGNMEIWIGYKLHIDVANGQIPVSRVLTSASVLTVRSPFP